MSFLLLTLLPKYSLALRTQYVLLYQTFLCNFSYTYSFISMPATVVLAQVLTRGEVLFSVFTTLIHFLFLIHDCVCMHTSTYMYIYFYIYVRTYIFYIYTHIYVSSPRGTHFCSPLFTRWSHISQAWYLKPPGVCMGLPASIISSLRMVFLLSPPPSKRRY